MNKPRLLSHKVVIVCTEARLTDADRVMRGDEDGRLTAVSLC